MLTPNSSPIQVPPIKEKGKFRVDGAFEGGGAKGFCYLGALDAVQRSGVWFKRVSGCSAGSIIAALIAAGYTVDPDYNINLNTPPQKLQPNSKNSLNKIIFEDNYDGMYDLPKTLSIPEIEKSWTKALFDKLVPVNSVLSPLKDLRERMRKLNIGFKDGREKTKARDEIRTWLKDYKNFPPVGLNEKIATPIADAVVNTKDWVIDPVGEAIRSQAVKLLDFIPDDISLNLLLDIYMTKKDDPDPIKATKQVYREGFTILERGGLLAGDFFRDWIENHLQARYNVQDGITGKSAKGYIAFKDMPIDLCIATFCMDCKTMIYFSKKSTPEYSVSEAVRRSMSLPIAFVPRRLNEGHPGVIPPNLTEHSDHIIIDGGIRVDLPASVFRDKGGKSMDYQPDVFLLCFKLNELKNMPDKSAAGIPIMEDINVPRLDPLVVETVFPPIRGEIDTSNFIPPGVNLMMKQIAAINEATSSREEEIIKDISVWDKTGIIDIGVKEMAGGDPRPWMFNISKKGKKWMSKSGWEAALQCLNNLPNSIKSNLNIPGKIDPYGP